MGGRDQEIVAALNAALTNSREMLVCAQAEDWMELVRQEAKRSRLLHRVPRDCSGIEPEAEVAALLGELVDINDRIVALTAKAHAAHALVLRQIWHGSQACRIYRQVGP